MTTTRRRPALRLSAVYLPPLLLLTALTVLLHGGRDVFDDQGAAFTLWVEDLGKDPVTVADLPPYVGLVSHLGVLIWCVAGAVALFTAVLLHRAGRGPQRNLFAGLGALTLLLTADDLLLLHDGFFPRFLGLPEEITFVLYGAAFLAVVLANRRVLRRQPNLAVLGVAVAFFGISIGIDLLDPDLPQRAWYEDFPMFLGIVGWSVFLTAAALRAATGIGSGAGEAAGAEQPQLQDAPAGS